ncbi:DedA family protein [Sphingobium lactosutens]|uniref:DedA family protein n=1 Tax=Sphingobium lactosutens TaxID=522773 RepID=UPI0015BC4C47|nr:DedA family protein [Sphingobium lactosutens]NWK94579.1 DedA family protein [Sphingobium lactosutens]
MDDLASRATLLVASYGAWAGPVIALLSFGESLAVIGVLIPATAVMIAIGGLIGAGTLDPVPVYIWAAVGAILGDWLSYLIGRRIGPSVYRRWPLNRHRSMVARTRLFFRKYGFLSIFFGRFLGPVRATIPLVAGVMNMAPKPFQIANLLSALLWVPLMFAPGYLAGSSLGPSVAITEWHLIAFGAGIMVLTFAATFITSKILGDPRMRARRRAQRMNRQA